jgi:hypothetical protein
MSTHAETAKAIRKDLNREFPLITFRVTSKSYSGGNSVRVSWNNGPTSDAVKKVICKYQYGHFNGMEDIYEYTNSRNDIPQVRHVFADREVSQDIKDKVFEYLQSTHAHFNEVKTMDESSQVLMNHWSVWTAREYIYRITDKLDLTHGYNPNEEENTLCNC